MSFSSVRLMLTGSVAIAAQSPSSLVLMVWLAQVQYIQPWLSKESQVLREHKQQAMKPMKGGVLELFEPCMAQLRHNVQV